MSKRTLLSSLTVTAVGLGAKGVLNFLCSDIQVVGLSYLLNALEGSQSQSRRRNGVLTVSNHISVVDDPLMWGVLPSSHYTRSRPIRWALGASDICFTNPLFTAFFRQGQVLETFRGKGIKQAAVNRAISLLNAGEWVHIFPEGGIAQPQQVNLRRIKWGIGRILMEVEETPTIIPMWLTGFDAMMPDKRKFPRFLPRSGKSVSVTFGESDVVERRVNARLNPQLSSNLNLNIESNEASMRMEITRIIQEELEALGKQVSGKVKGPRRREDE